MTFLIDQNLATELVSHNFIQVRLTKVDKQCEVVQTRTVLTATVCDHTVVELIKGFWHHPDTIV